MITTYAKAVLPFTLLAAALGAPPATAHHSLAKFDGNRVIKIEGTITAFRWVNPHASLRIDGTAEGDAPDGSWAIEMSPRTSSWAKVGRAIRLRTATR